MSITHLNSLSQLNGILDKSKDKLNVIDFHATWCGPCRTIAPFYESLSKEHTNVNFMKCDVDAAKEIALEYKVASMPTFLFLKGSTKVDQVVGADKSGLQNAIRKHAVVSTSSFSGKGHTLGGAPAAPDVVGEVKQTLDGVSAGWNTLDPQLKVLVGLLGLYLLFWYYG